MLIQSVVAAALIMRSFVGVDAATETSEPSSRPAEAPGEPQSLSYWENATMDGPDMASNRQEAAPLALAMYGDLLEHGPSARLEIEPVTTSTGAVQWRFGCLFSIADNNGNYWDFTYDARLIDPNDNQIKQHGAWAHKPSFSSELAETLYDPVEGTYRCTIQWYVGGFELPQRQATATISYTTPSSETTLQNAWAGSPYGTVFKWRGRLNGGNYAGRQVSEEDGGGHVDTCYFAGGPFDPEEGLSGGLWDVDSSSEYGDDGVGWAEFAVSVYRNHNRAPCRFEVDQIMKINRPGSSWVSYKTNRLKAGFTSTTVWSERDGQVVSKNH